MSWTALNFGKHQGKTLPQVLFTDPDWFFWAYEDGVFSDRGLRWENEAERAYVKSTSIRIPQTGTETLVAEYNFVYGSYVSAGFDLVEESRPIHQGSTATQRAKYIDLSIPRRQKNYDKSGYKIFLQSLKYCLFGSVSARMTRQRCDEFFDDSGNFHRNP